ncbi:hypothetical protein QFC24_000357 [Naganishia onofrii]|uniref:Uncharacterized protein n=1 Tax=Naganishia onofrii TaxID=1851511 RepID=A0ACC2XXU8_9TREE|nr:hypothetical protein QFC24_000357 [Naganishia onofrii]
MVVAPPPPFIKSIDILGFDKILHFPTSAVFQYLPPTLVPFREYDGDGIYVPLALTADREEGVQRVQGTESQDSGIERDGYGIPTIPLNSGAATHDPAVPRPFRTRLGAIARLPVDDAWRLGQDPGFREPKGTGRGGYSR